jgi:hypothetical protein
MATDELNITNDVKLHIQELVQPLCQMNNHGIYEEVWAIETTRVSLEDPAQLLNRRGAILETVAIPRKADG